MPWGVEPAATHVVPAWCGVALGLGLWLSVASAAGADKAAPTQLTPLAAATAMPAAPWVVRGLPRQTLPMTRFGLTNQDGRRALRIEADGAYGNLVHPLARDGNNLRLAWQWWLQRGLPDADLRTKAGDDAALKVCVFFDVPLNRLGMGEQWLMRLAQSRSPEPLPVATLCYVWDTRLPVGTAVDNAYTRRVRYLVLQSGPGTPNGWMSERRDVAADFKRLFGDESPQVPAVTGIAIGADADNTHGHSLAFVADLTLEP